jgi:Uma2 family endonuclease
LAPDDSAHFSDNLALLHATVPSTMAALQKPWTIPQFLDWEERQAARYEFDGAGPVAMTGGTAARDAIKMNLSAALVGRLRGTACRAHGADLKIEAGGGIRYPDAFVTCSPIDRRATTAREPVVIFEVLSSNTATVDRIVKNREYRSIPSVRRYVMLEQDRIAATAFERQGDHWISHILVDDAIVAMPEIGCAIPLAELYDGIDFTKTAAEEDAAEG